MKIDGASSQRGITVVEVVVVIAILLIVIGMFFPHMGPNVKTKGPRIACVINLKEIGLAYRSFALDHSGRYWTNRSPEAAAIREPTQDAADLWRQFLPPTIYLARPTVLWCPADTERRPAAAYVPNPTDRRAVVFTPHQNLSYFFGMNASEENPQSILAGDRNLTTNGVAVGPGFHTFATGTRIGYTEKIHVSAGNILLGDGSVQQGSNGRVKEMFQDAPTGSPGATNIWFIP